jgi:hypothetical protein
MKNYLTLATSVSALLVSGCGQKESASAPASAPAVASAAPAPATAAPRVIEITAGDNMKFNITAIEAKPGETLKIILTNIGQMPKEAMGHNIVILKKAPTRPPTPPPPLRQKPRSICLRLSKTKFWRTLK